MSGDIVTVVGGGLAGCEAAWQLAQHGRTVVIIEMKPRRFSPAHSSPLLAELVCSNSLGSGIADSAPGLLKEEMRRLGSLIIEAADATSVPAGKALAVDRQAFSRHIESRISALQNVSIIRDECTNIPPEGAVVIATGPLTSDVLANAIAELTGRKGFFFYDAIAPIVDVDSIDFGRIFAASRYDEGSPDYLNCPMTEEEYLRFHNALLSAEEVALKNFEERKYFEGCLPVEILAQRGTDTLRFGPMKPVGLRDPRTGRRPYAVVQLRRENLEGTMFNLVGFQTKLTWSEQRRVFRMIPGLENAEFVRYGSIHRNTFINSPALLRPTLELQCRPGLYFAGQITGVEGYIESAASGLLAGLCAAVGDSALPPRETALGALVNHISATDKNHYQPMNINFGLFPPLDHRYPRKERGRRQAERALRSLNRWIKETLDQRFRE
ncbi:MAG: methylenetetrahydrofolate--tRNA-(uracil(54)-C(5))-methyltransferase (FADH(2)-oxidizing) TrmFO [Deltaproteobacteria bacterium]|nr:methylenetetrahydrofolate--tRNA-(uracil(54)-C(5))-methyltransferase (FADH(2)-oxidizing) TrmFO [Deltaproteobacteria bacterium]